MNSSTLPMICSDAFFGLLFRKLSVHISKCRFFISEDSEDPCWGRSVGREGFLLHESVHPVVVIIACEVESPAGVPSLCWHVDEQAAQVDIV